MDQRQDDDQQAYGGRPGRDGLLGYIVPVDQPLGEHAGDDDQQPGGGQRSRQAVIGPKLREPRGVAGAQRHRAEHCGGGNARDVLSRDPHRVPAGRGNGQGECQPTGRAAQRRDLLGESRRLPCQMGDRQQAEDRLAGCRHGYLEREQRVLADGRLAELIEPADRRQPDQSHRGRGNDVGPGQLRPPVDQGQFIAMVPNGQRRGQIHTQRRGQRPTFAPQPDRHDRTGKRGDGNGRRGPGLLVIVQRTPESQNHGRDGRAADPNGRRADECLGRAKSPGQGPQRGQPPRGHGHQHRVDGPTEHERAESPLGRDAEDGAGKQAKRSHADQSDKTRVDLPPGLGPAIGDRPEDRQQRGPADRTANLTGP